MGSIGEFSYQLIPLIQLHMKMFRNGAKKIPLIFTKLCKFKITRKRIKIIEFCLLQRDFKGYILEISYQLIPLLILLMNMDRKPAKYIHLIFLKNYLKFKITRKSIKIIDFWL